MSRQLWLRERATPYLETDPRPVEGAVLVDTADTMMDMVRSHVRAAALEQRDAAADDEPFLPDHLVAEAPEALLSPHEDSHPFLESALSGLTIASAEPAEESRDSSQGDPAVDVADRQETTAPGDDSTQA